MDNSKQLYRLQIALKSGSGFELLTTMDEVQVVHEIEHAVEHGVFAHIATYGTTMPLGSIQFAPGDLSAYMHTPVTQREQ